jgi:hypothetical protein
MVRYAAWMVLPILMWSVVARADDVQPSPERIKAAADEFDLGRRAFLTKDFEQAAAHFENAFRDAPSQESLRLAIRARTEAKQLARAATLAAVAQTQYPNDAATAKLAKDTLANAGPELAEYVVTCASTCTVAADGRVVSQTDGAHHRVFLEPGPHELGVSFSQGSVSKHVDGAKGSSNPLSFDGPAPTPTPTPVPTPTPEPVPVPNPGPEKSAKPLPPFVFFIAAGVTAAAGAATIVSGVDTQNDPGPDAVRRECAGKGESCPLYQEGQDAETRTNILLGVTVGTAILTGVIGLFFTQWKSSGLSSSRFRTVVYFP